MLKKPRRIRRLKRVRAKLLKTGKTHKRVRLTVFRSNKHFYAQLIDDSKGKTLASCSEKEITGDTRLSKMEKASVLGKLIAEKAKKKGISEVMFDRGYYNYHGRVKTFAESAREAGIKF